VTNHDLQNKVIVLLEDGYTVLAESERFVHQIQRRFRLRRIEEGKSGWDTAKIFTLNRWMENFWTELWPEDLPASSPLLRWKYLKECLDDIPPPEPLTADVELIRLLDESIEQCLRYAIDPAGGEEVNRLIGWRRQVWSSFDDKLARSGLFHPAWLPLKISARLHEGAKCAKMAFVGFEFAGHWEKYLIEELQKKAGALLLTLPAGDAQPELLVYSDPEQEITGLMETLVMEAARCAPHEIAVVLCDSKSYSPAISNRLQDILGEPLRGNLAAYNLCPDRDLSGQALYNAAFLQIRCALGGEKRGDLFAFLRSPYYRAFSRWSRRLSLWDRIWRENGVESGIDAMLDTVCDSTEQIFPGACSVIKASIAPFLDRGLTSVSNWTGTLRRIWTDLEFPVIANELDQITWDNLVQLISEFEKAFGETRVSARDFSDLLTVSAGRTPVQKSGVEDAGIQILSALDARGLSFRRVFIPGLISGSFPQPVRSLPLLSSSERKKVLGGTIESQFSFARHIYANFRAAAPQIVLSRPAISKEGQLCLASAFWIDEGEKKIDPVIPWKHRLPAMQRARWVQQSALGIKGSGSIEGAKAFCPDGRPDFQIQPLAFSGSISVSQLQSALLCPTRYFFRYVLGLEVLAEFEPGIQPLERGKRIHSILACFVLRAIEKFKESDPNFQDLAGLLRETITEALQPCQSEAVWQVELERLTGKPGSPGLLLKWLESEWERMLDGWSWMAVELPFDGLQIEDCVARLRGRLDRIDSHPQLGLICWDYKTGRIPGKTEVMDENEQPQLKAYLLALSRGHVAVTPKADDGCGAGYIELRSPADTKHQIMFDPAEPHGPFLKDWEKTVSASLNSIFAGNISPRWLKENQPCEERCEYKDICGSP
jgi:RecB family exonuclease